MYDIVSTSKTTRGMTVSNLYYKSNNAREAVYEKMRREEEIMSNEQQDMLDLKSLESLEEMAQAKKYSRLIKNTMGEIISTSPAFSKLAKVTEPVIEIVATNLEDLVKTKKLDEFVKKLNELEFSDLSKIQQLIVNDLNDPFIKNLINEEMSKLIANGKSNKEIASELEKYIIGENPPSKYKNALQSLIQKSLAKPAAEMRSSMMRGSEVAVAEELKMSKKAQRSLRRGASAKSDKRGGK